MNANPTQIVVQALHEVNLRSGDPRFTFVNLLTSASIAGKILGLSQQEIAEKLEEVEQPAQIIFKNVIGDRP